MSRTQLIPSDEHPITITPTAGRVTVKVGDTVVAESDRAVTLQESNYPGVQYLPLDDVDQTLITSTDTATYCPYKGDASYYSITTPAGTIDDAIWSYAQPYEAVSEIAGYVAFYPNKVELTVA
ncbi:MAG: DUF427 domain-containing protein [Solirubrobacteraceae bacterium]|nr:DUF427 domain-containing protein [Solirubrobacteraceae bacterium]